MRSTGQSFDKTLDLLTPKAECLFNIFGPRSEVVHGYALSTDQDASCLSTHHVSLHRLNGSLSRQREEEQNAYYILYLPLDSPSVLFFLSQVPLYVSF